MEKRIRYFTIGDIHGQFDKLSLLLDHLYSYANLDLRSDILIFTGDYVDRGLDSKKVIETLVRLKNDYPDNVICLKGNHESMLISYLDSNEMLGGPNRSMF